MTFHDHDEAPLDVLTHLPVLEADSRRAERTRLRCRAQLERRRHARVPSAVVVPSPRLASAILSVFCVFCVVYVAALLATAIRLGALRH